jgi:hypothetical protein
MSDIRKRMAHVRATTCVQLHQPKWVDRRWDEMNKELGLGPLSKRWVRHGVRTTDAHLKALARAEEYFGINEEDYEQNAYKFLAMAMALFPGGKHEKGRPKGTKTWTNQKLLDLADAFCLIKEKTPPSAMRKYGSGSARVATPRANLKITTPPTCVHLSLK